MADLFPKQELIATMHCQPGALLPCKLDWPLQRIRYWGGHPADSRPPAAPLWRDAWGVGWQKTSTDPGLTPFPIEHPLEGRLDEALRFTPPDPTDRQLFADLAHRRYPSDHLLVGEHPFAVYERAWLLMGVNPLHEAMMDHPDHVEELFRRIGEFQLGIARGYLGLKVEAAWIADDYSAGPTAMLSREMWRRFVRPYLERLIELYHAAGALVILHSHGNIAGLIDDFVEVGIDVLDPLQPSCNRLDWIRERTAGRICISGGVDSAILLSGDAGRTVAQTHERIALLGSGGGYIVGPDDDWDFPAATREAMLGAVAHERDAARRERR